MPARSTPEAFWASLVEGENGCLEFSGSRDSQGYGQLTFVAITGHYRPIRAHRIAWALTHGDLPRRDEGHIHHECRNKPCCNPAHLRLVTATEHRNIHNGWIGCKRHGEASLSIQSGKRKCLICDADRQRKRRANDPGDIRRRDREYKRVSRRRATTSVGPDTTPHEPKGLHHHSARGVSTDTRAPPARINQSRPQGGFVVMEHTSQ